MRIKIIKKADTGTKVDNVCPWIIDMPPEKSRA